MSPILLLTFLLTHWVADFVLQRHEDAVNKSKSFSHLLSHTSTYSAFWFPVLCVIKPDLQLAIRFCSITFLLHTLTDYYTSRLNSYLWKKGDVHNFFVAVGFDQVLHYVQLYLTFVLLS